MCVAEANESSRKRLKTMDAKENENKEGDESEAFDEHEDDKNEADLYQHIKESEKGTAETIDAATKVSCLSQIYK